MDPPHTHTQTTDTDIQHIHTQKYTCVWFWGDMDAKVTFGLYVSGNWDVPFTALMNRHPP